MMNFRMSRYVLPEINELRAVKSAREVGYITKAQRVSEGVLKLALRRLKVGVSEVTLARFIVAEFKRQGILALAFEPIVAFGKGTADIHHWATSAKLKAGDTVMFDFGATCQGYCSDMTRTFFFGALSAKQKRVYLTVLQAQERVLLQLAQGERRAGALDAGTRAIIVRRFGKRAFPHSVGHGIGTVIHEWPYLKPKSRNVLRPGMVVTIEPAVYLPGWGGVRIEDMVLIKQRGINNLTRAAKDLTLIIIRP